MIRLLHLILLANVLLSTSNSLPYKRSRRQTVLNRNENLPYEGWSGGSNNPSGAIPGAYYGTGSNPNYGGVKPNRNDVEGGINVVSYNHDYIHNNNNNNYNSNWNQQQQQQQQQYYRPNNNYNNAGQRPNNNNNNNNNNNYNNRPNNRYAPGSQGWYATGGNYWYNKGQYLVPHAWILIVGLSISVVCTL